MDPEADSLVLVSNSPSFSFFFSALAFLSNANLQERTVYTHHLQFLVSGSHLNSLKLDFCPHYHNETRLRRSKFSYLPWSINSSSHWHFYTFDIADSCFLLKNVWTFQDTALSVLPTDYLFCFLLLASFSSVCLKCRCFPRVLSTTCYFPPLLTLPRRFRLLPQL